MDASAVAALLGALIGSLAAVAGQVLAARYASRNERRRLAVEAGYREWEHMKERGGRLLPPVVFIHYSNELMTLLDRDKLTPETYREVIRRRDGFRAVIEEDHARRTGEQR